MTHSHSDDDAMRTFILHDDAGNILSVCRTETLAPDQETPFGHVGTDEGVVEVTERKGLATLSLEEIHDAYRVSTGSGKLVKRR